MTLHRMTLTRRRLFAAVFATSALGACQQIASIGGASSPEPAAAAPRVDSTSPVTAAIEPGFAVRGIRPVAAEPTQTPERALRPTVVTADPEASMRQALAASEAHFDAGRYREALAILDAGPVPDYAADLVALRRAELSLNLGDESRASAEISSPAVASATNRIIASRGAEVAERVGKPGLAGELWARAAQQPTWFGERARAFRQAGRCFIKAGAIDRVADMAAALVDMGGRSAEAVAIFRPAADYGPHHAGLVALLGADFEAAAASFREYLRLYPGGTYAAAAARRLNALGKGAEPDAGWSAVRDTDTAEAYRAWWTAHPNHARAADARFFEGVAHFREDRYVSAVEVWATAAGANAPAESRARALYWIGKAQMRLGDVDGGRRRWQAAAAIKPSNYYVARARDRLAGFDGWPDGPSQLPSTMPTSAEAAEADDWISQWATDVPSAADDLVVRRARLFAAVGLSRTAGAELDGPIESSTNARFLAEAGRAAVENGLWMSSARAGLRLGRISPEGTPLDAPRAIRRLAFPMAYREAVVAESARAQIGPLLLLSLIRQESFYDRFAVSSADARGLTQMMPATGAEIARSLGRTGFQADELYEAATAVAYGARYVAAQLKAFDGDVFHAIAAYNAGGGPVRRWRASAGDPDIFVETIPYNETRAYVRSVYEYHAIYRALIA